MSESMMESVSNVKGGTHILNEAFIQKHHEEAARILEFHSPEDILRIIQGTSAKNAANKNKIIVLKYSGR